MMRGKRAEEAAESTDDRTSALLQALAQVRQTLQRERRSAPSQVAELLAEPPATQLARLDQDAELHTWGVCELLLRHSVDREDTDPAESGRLATLVLAVAGHLDRDRHPASVVEDLKARAWAGVGEAERRQGHLRGAEEGLRKAAESLSQGTGDLLVEAQLLEFEAALRYDQGRPSEAAALLKQAATRYLTVNDPEPLARVLLKRDQLRETSGTTTSAAPFHLALDPIT